MPPPASADTAPDDRPDASPHPDATPAAPGPGWVAVVPVKDPSHAKTRLAPVLGERREPLADAFAHDLVDALLRTPAVGRVLVVTSGEGQRERWLARGAEVRPDPPPGPGSPLDAAVTSVARGLDRGTPVVVLTGDLPAARPADLQRLLVLAAQLPDPGLGVVADLEGTGTTVLLALAAEALAPSFGPGSLARHVALGATPLPAARGLRRDVDVAAHLDAAEAMGVGARTAAALAATRVSRPGS